MKNFKAIGFLLASTIVATPAFAEKCANTTFSGLASISCRGAFVGNINGSPDEITYLDTAFAGPFTYGGKSNDMGHGPFKSNPMVAKDGTLTFDSALTGTFVIGLKVITQHSYYYFDALTPVSSVTFKSTAGVYKDNKGNPEELGHATIYYGTAMPVPEPETYALMLGGIGALAFIGRRRSSMLKSA